VKLNTSFVERLNLTIGQGSSYLGRRTHAKPEGSNIDDDLELLRLILREIFSSRELFCGAEACHTRVFRQRPTG
jgi:hypothetical protein